MRWTKAYLAYKPEFCDISTEKSGSVARVSVELTQAAIFDDRNKEAYDQLMGGEVMPVRGMTGVVAECRREVVVISLLRDLTVDNGDADGAILAKQDCDRVHAAVDAVRTCDFTAPKG